MRDAEIEVTFSAGDQSAHSACVRYTQAQWAQNVIVVDGSRNRVKFAAGTTNMNRG